MQENLEKTKRKNLKILQKAVRLYCFLPIQRWLVLMKPQLIKCQHSGKKQMPRLKQLQRCLNYFYPKKSLTLQLIGFPSWNLTTGYASINSSGAHPPLGNHGAFAQMSVPGVGH